MKTGNVVVEKSKAFALRIINLYRYLKDEKREHSFKAGLEKRYEYWGKCQGSDSRPKSR